MAQTIGGNLKVDRSAWARQLSLALQMLIQKTLLAAKTYGSTVNTTYPMAEADARVFHKAGAPTASTAADSPGGDMCFIIDDSAFDIYLVYNWVSKDSFLCIKMLNGV